MIKLPPNAAPAPGSPHGVEKVALNFIDGIIDPNIKRYRDERARTRSNTPTPPGSPWGDSEEPAAPVNSTDAADPNEWKEVVRGNRRGSQWPKPNHAHKPTHANLSAKSGPKGRDPPVKVPKKVPAAFDRSKLREELGADGEDRVRSEGVADDAHSALAEYAKTSISTEHIDKNSVLRKKLENPSQGVSNEQVTHTDMQIFVEAVVKPNPLLPKSQLKDLKTPKNLKPFLKSLLGLVDKHANMGTSNAIQITPSGFKKDKGTPVYFYSVAMTSLEGKANLLAYKWAPQDLIYKYYVEFREESSKVQREEPGVWFRVPLAQTAANKHDPPPLSQCVQCLMEAGLEESDIIGDFSMGSKPDVERNSVSKVFEPFLYFKLDGSQPKRALVRAL